MVWWTKNKMKAFQSGSDRFGINRGSAHRCFIEVCRTVKKFVYPDSRANLLASDTWRVHCGEVRESVQISRFSGNDGCHVPIKPPSLDRNSYINRKGFASVNMMAVCDHTQKFMYCYVQTAGLVRNIRIFCVSQVGEKALRNQLFISNDYHLLADSTHLLPPQVSQVWPISWTIFLAESCSTNIMFT